MKIFRLLAGLLILGAMVGAVVLVKNNQETRRGAAYATITASLLPDSQVVTVGQKFYSTMKLNADVQKVTAFDVRVSFDGAKLKVNKVEGLNSVLVLMDPIIDQAGGKVRVISASSNIANVTLPTGVIDLFKIEFEALTTGEAEVTMGSDSIVVGYNSGNDPVLAVAAPLPRAVYTVSGGGAPSLSPTATPTPTTKLNAECTSNSFNVISTTADHVAGGKFKFSVGPINAPTGRVLGTVYLKVGVGTTTNSFSYALTDCVGLTSCTLTGKEVSILTTDANFPSRLGQTMEAWVVAKTRMPGGTADLVDVATACTDKPTEPIKCNCGVRTVQLGTVPTATPTNTPGQITPTVTPTAGQTSGAIDFRIKFGGLGMETARCASWKVDAKVLLADGSLVDLGLVNLVKGGSGEEPVYGGRVTLTGVSQVNGLALLLKGPKHLRTKYAVQGQVDYYNRSLGQLTIGEEYDFTGYPMLPGDVTGLVEGQPDGSIDGLDFAYVKSKIGDEVSVGGEVMADLDGSCAVNSRDVILLLNSLSKRQEQMY